MSRFIARSWFGLVWLTLLTSCEHGEMDREEMAASKALPKRLMSSGAIHLSSNDQKALGLEVGQAINGALPDCKLRYGAVRARLDEEALVVSPVAGRVTRAPRVALGAEVSAGSALVQVTTVLSAAERVTLGIQGADISGQIEAASRELITRRTEAQRASELAESKIVSLAQLQTAETAVATTEARLNALRRARTIQMQGQGGAVTLNAPTAGTLVTLDAVVGAVVMPGAVLARILKPGPRWIDVAVPSGDSTGDAYEAQAGSEWVRARLLSRGAVVQADGFRHDRLEIDANSAGKFLPGATVAIRIAEGKEPGIVVPQSALVPGVDYDTVYVEAPADTFVPHRVTVAARFDGKARVAEGIAVGDRIVTKGAMALRGEAMRGELGNAE